MELKLNMVVLARNLTLTKEEFEASLGLRTSLSLKTLKRMEHNWGGQLMACREGRGNMTGLEGALKKYWAMSWEQPSSHSLASALVTLVFQGEGRERNKPGLQA